MATNKDIDSDKDKDNNILFLRYGRWRTHVDGQLVAEEELYDRLSTGVLSKILKILKMLKILMVITMSSQASH